ncbi:type II toxin-antitoxin system VapB family antitoxin [Brevundimonas sp.]|uniref:type II toxin-antitoxin system VapB family antitoxin n=1 Tax=Brevundimonas sp. TaxID=1871086 RepID=UPI001D70AC3F|nr:type II toxin-antitoxin system VapB family antitoxin [Brevundimonas sp.]MBL0947388.1 type II toxin-antitoxin system VapB family antitoxin [Brevundimonas sp.]
MLNIKNPEAHRLAKDLARRRGESLTAVVTYALREQLAREPEPVKKKATREEVEAILQRMRKAAPPEFFAAEDPTAVFYDPETGLPA